MAKVKKRRLVWNPSTSSNIVGYKLYWSQEGNVTYDSPFAMIGNVTEVVLPDQVPSFPVVNGAIQLGITAMNEIGNESDMTVVTAPFQFSVPEAPASPRLEALKEYYVLQGSGAGTGDPSSGDDIADPDPSGDQE
jgi:hypothetical protein